MRSAQESSSIPTRVSLCQVQKVYLKQNTWKFESATQLMLHRYLVDWIAETSDDLRLDCATVHVAAFFLDRVLLHAHDDASGRCQVPKHLWQLVAMVCLRIAGKFEEREEDVTGDGSATLLLANGVRINSVEAFTSHLGDAAMSVTSSQVKVCVMLLKKC